MSDGLSTPASIDRWEASGGTWAVTRVGEGSATVDLMRCDGGEIVERILLTASEDLRWAAAQRS